ncbi:hypothetical protein ACCS70_29540 [Rhizobium ruizarguesonis]
MQYSHKKGSVPFGTPRRALAGTAALLLSAFALPAFAENRSECEARWLKAEAAGIIYGSGIVEGKVTVVVDEDVFRSVPYETKAGMGVTLDCIVAGPGKVLSEAQFISHRTHKRLALWSWGKLTVD